MGKKRVGHVCSVILSRLCMLLVTRNSIYRPNIAVTTKLKTFLEIVFAIFTFRSRTTYFQLNIACVLNVSLASSLVTWLTVIPFHVVRNNYRGK